MRRRDFIKLIGLGFAGAGFSIDALAETLRPRLMTAALPVSSGAWIKDYLHKMHNFDEHHPQDRFVSPAEAPVFHSVRKRLLRVQRTVGYGNFHLIGFDETLQIAKNYSRVGAFPRRETDFLEKMFYRDAAEYGFYGVKATWRLTAAHRRQDVIKINRTGNYLYRGKPLEMYQKLLHAVGPDAILTSGIRSVMKQFVLFFNKAYNSDLNLSMASRSLAPPGYSYHSVGDFDVGKVGFGAANFTEKFASTDVFRRLTDQGFVNLRYCRDNLLGVRFEPWHIKVAA
jgi:hypothetical protein